VKTPQTIKPGNVDIPPKIWPSILGVSVLIALIAVSSWGYSRRSEAEIKASKEKELLATARLKSDMVSDWVSERFKDALTISENPITAYRVKSFFEQGTDGDSEELLRSYLASLVSIGGYKTAILYDSQGGPRITVPEEGGNDCPELREGVLRSVKTRAIVFTDIHFGTNGRDILMFFSAPVLERGRDGFSVLGVVSMVSDPHQFLYPLIERWPTPSRTAETLLVRREGDNVIYLNELRHRKNTALRLVLPVSSKDLPAAAAVSGYEGVIEGVDYRGVKVVAALTPVQGTPWYMVSKIDASEVYLPIRNMEMAVFMLAFLAIASLVSITFLYYRKTQAEFLSRRYSLDLERHVAELSAVNKELDAFSYSVSHDLRTPLRAIDGFSRILEEEHGPRLEGDARRLLGVVRQSAARMSQLIDDLLAFSHIGRQELTVADIDMEHLAMSAYKEIANSAGARDIVFEVRPMPRASGDHAMLKQVFLNLLSNSIKFTRHRATAHIEAGGWSKSGENVYYVKDDGVGFDMNYAGKLFGVFQRLHPQEDFEGTGVGLALVERIVRRHGGRAWAEGKPGLGATVYFSLPGAAK
jgi:signal transduction histidine kinase